MTGAGKAARLRTKARACAGTRGRAPTRGAPTPDPCPYPRHPVYLIGTLDSRFRGNDGEGAGKTEEGGSDGTRGCEVPACAGTTGPGGAGFLPAQERRGRYFTRTTPERMLRAEARTPPSAPLNMTSPSPIPACAARSCVRARACAGTRGRASTRGAPTPDPCPHPRHPVCLMGTLDSRFRGNDGGGAGKTEEGLRGSCLRRNDGGRGCGVPAFAGTTGARGAGFLPAQERRE